MATRRIVDDYKAVNELRVVKLSKAIDGEVLAGARDGAAPFLFRYPHAGGEHETFRSVLCFWQDALTGAARSQSDAGPSAMARVIAAPEDYRFIQSFKTFAASPLFDSTRIYGESYDFPDLLAVFLEHFFEALRLHTGNLPQRIVVGRPVRFAGDPTTTREPSGPSSASASSRKAVTRRPTRSSSS